MTILERSTALEEQILSPQATKSSEAQRAKPQQPCSVRTEFQRDRDRILHCKSFRRLKHKTQVFLSPEGDHYRTRLTHTLEVSQIARTVARALRLNEDLTEAVALGHDLGHTPYGHAGETALASCCPHGYLHAQQSVRVVERLENGGQGLNLTAQVLDGIACHSFGGAKTLEGQLVLFADKIAYMNHDIEDAIRAGIITEEGLPWQVRYTVGRSKSQRIETFVLSLIENSQEKIAMSAEVTEAFGQLKAFLFEAVYNNPVAKGEEGKARGMLVQLYQSFLETPTRLPPEYLAIAEQEGIDRAVCDYISGMTDRFALSIYDQLFVPRAWGQRG